MEDSESDLVALLFGSGSLLENEEEDGAVGGEELDDEAASAFDVADAVHAAEEGDGEVDRADQRGVKRGRSTAANAAAWVDEDDATVVVDIAAVNRLRKLRHARSEHTISGTELSDRLREQFSATHADVVWGKPASKKKTKTKKMGQGGGAGGEVDSDDSDAGYDGGDAEEIFRTTAPLVASSEAGGPLPANVIEVKRDPDGNEAERSSAVVQAVDFHPNGQIMLTAGFDKTLRFFRIDGARNPKLQVCVCVVIF